MKENGDDGIYGHPTPEVQMENDWRDIHIAICVILGLFIFCWLFGIL